MNENCTRMVQTILNKFWKQHPIREHLYSHLPPISKTIQIKMNKPCRTQLEKQEWSDVLIWTPSHGTASDRWTRQVGHSWRSKDKLKSYILLSTPSHGHASVGWPRTIYLQQLCTDTGCSLEDLLGARDDKDKWQDRAREICASCMIWWYIYIHIYNIIIIIIIMSCR